MREVLQLILQSVWHQAQGNLELSMLDLVVDQPN